jgi:ATP phosphoribosyltransferase
MKSSDEKRPEIATLLRKLKCVVCDREIVIYVPIEEADSVASVTPGYCNCCLAWIVRTETSALISEMLH